jgi:uncharacterized protein (TIGR00290 family)
MPSRVLALSWSGGKDSALALWALQQEHGIRPHALITTVTDAYARVSMHGVRRELLARQAEAVGVPLVEVEIPAGCTNDLYEQRMTEAFASATLRDVDCVAFGDLFLEDIRAYREDRLAAAGKRGLFPLWKRDTASLAREFIAAGFEATLVCVDPRHLDPSFAGRPFDAQLLDDLPPDVDPCGENGEFHTFVHAGPVLSRPVACSVGETVKRDGFVFCDLLPVDSEGIPAATPHRSDFAHVLSPDDGGPGGGDDRGHGF